MKVQIGSAIFQDGFKYMRTDAMKTPIDWKQNFIQDKLDFL